jgi:MFS family permease
VNTHRPRLLLPLIIVSQFAGTSLWFAGNAVLPELTYLLSLNTHAISQITAAVQLGFITGTLVFAVFSIADRFSSTNVFFASTTFAAAANLALIWFAADAFTVFSLRFITGFFLAGIYPVGMKIAADWYEKGLGKALGYLVGALVLGTSFPHFLRVLNVSFFWQNVLIATSIFAFIGGVLMKLFIGDGPYRKQGAGFEPRALVNIFRSKPFRAAAFGYFGHMWELYTFWAFLPVLVGMYVNVQEVDFRERWIIFYVIAAGSISCVLGGYWAQRAGSKRVAWYSLLCSGICCIAAPFMMNAPEPVFLAFLFVWGLSVISDSPQFSTLVAQSAPLQHKGTALTFVTSIGFFITVVSMFVFDQLLHATSFSPYAFATLAIGPLIGLICLGYKLRPNGRHNS